MAGAADWRWRNVPVPEPHVGGLVVGTVLHWLRPWPLPTGGWLQFVAGAVLLAVGLGVVAWAVRAVGRRDVADPGTLVTGGPYRYSRHPMYVAWTVLYVGVALLADEAWFLVLLPVVAAAVHGTVRREERRLERQFGEAYRRYRAAVRRYL